MNLNIRFNNPLPVFFIRCADAPRNAMRHFSVVCTLAHGDRPGAPRMISPAPASIPAQRRIQPEPKETNMQSATFRMICRVLIAPVMALSVHTARADMIGADQVSLAAAAQTERNSVLNALGRPAVTSELQALGVDPQAARDRVAAMSDEELDALAGKMNSLPVGGEGLVVVLLIVLLIVVLLRRR